MKELIEQISTFGDTFIRNAETQLDKGNKAAGLRARRASLELEPLLKRFRKLSLDASNNKDRSSGCPAYIHKSGQPQSIYYESQDTLSKKNSRTEQDRKVFA